LTKLYHHYRRFNDGLERVLLALASFIVAIVVLLPFASFTVRALTGEGYSFLVETAPQLVPWMVFPVLGILLRRDSHIAVDVLPHFLSGARLRTLRIVVLVICLIVTLMIGIFGISTTSFYAKLGQLSTTEIEFPLWYLYVSYPVGFLLAANFCLESLMGEWCGERVRVAGEQL
jgi:TRAP-type C4-dicarboxylate transport system permease small subunit